MEQPPNFRFLSGFPSPDLHHELLPYPCTHPPEQLHHQWAADCQPLSAYSTKPLSLSTFSTTGSSPIQHGRNVMLPSPPSSGSSAQRNVPLPPLTDERLETDLQYLTREYNTDDSCPGALLLKANDTRPQAPLSPPPTIAKFTFPLPPVDTFIDPPLIHEDRSNPQQHHVSSNDDCGTDASTYLTPLLSPISPEWHFVKVAAVEPLITKGPILLSSICLGPSPAFDLSPPPMDFLSEKGSLLPQSPLMELYDYSDCYPDWDPPSINDHSHDFYYEDFMTPNDYPSGSPSSPSRRSFSTLPPVDDHPAVSSPGLSILNLPGGEADDDLIPVDPDYDPQENSFASLPSPPVLSRDVTTSHTSNHRSGSLLLGDYGDVLPPRSPSPENFDLDRATVECSDPDFLRLCSLRTKFQALERAARQLEFHMFDAGSMDGRAEARRERKREKERTREVSTLLRLKLKEQGVNVMPEDSTTPSALSSSSPPSPSSSRSPSLHLPPMSPSSTSSLQDSPKGKGSHRKVAITTVSQLVATMILRRQETLRSPSPNRVPWSPKKYLQSPLRQFTLPELNEEAEDDGRGSGRSTDNRGHLSPLFDEGDDEDDDDADLEPCSRIALFPDSAPL